ncbi:DUF2911 domain-containing protein [Aquimarina sp. D1M17]|uniref:DUF2911 domain-containing protein n=1 Tax=Aquimarina acroporae TaxID=2937283 RepID=UPI0020BE74FA|nr:DUF2911 domain-containing protein [Aquimarina acroporae]MCK8523741.1 DUF2911 domain-containing protein [Aquimarina acroporae]
MYRLIFIIILSTTFVNAQITIPALSPKAKTTQTVGLTTIDIEYSRPSKRGREIFGNQGLLPNGEFWRTGANTATKITFGDDIKILNALVKKGSYTILTKPGASQWEVYFYPYQSGNWTSYTSQEPILKLNAKAIKLNDVVETFLINIDQISLQNAALVFSWDRTKIVLPLQVEVHEKTMKNITKVLSGPSDFDYFQAALYLHEAGKDLDTALEYIQKVTKGENARFFQVYREALILADLGRKKEAVLASQKSLELAKKAKNNDFIRLNQKFIENQSK